LVGNLLLKAKPVAMTSGVYSICESKIYADNSTKDGRGIRKNAVARFLHYL
jgi:hypothetical protein